MIENTFDKIQEQAKQLLENTLEEIELRTSFLKDAKTGMFEIANYLVEKYRIKTISDNKNDDIYIYDSGVYVLNGRNIIKKEIAKILGSDRSSHYQNEIIGHIVGKTLIDRKDFDVENKDLLCLNNGILNIKTKELLKHNPEYFFKTKIPVSFGPDTDCPKIKQFLSEVFYQDNIPVIQEWIGFCLLRDYLFKKAIIFVGSKNTGKSTFLNLLIRLIGSDNISGEDLCKLSMNRFSTINLYGKLVNIYDDLSFKDLVDVGIFKMAVGRSLLRGEQKFKDNFLFYSYAKMTFSCNRIPPLKEKDYFDDAYYDRWIVISMDNFIENKNTNLLKELTTEEELSGLLNYALEGLERLLANNGFSIEDNWEKTKKLMDMSGSPLACFVNDELIRSEDGIIAKDDMFNAYCEYAKKNKYSATTIKKIGGSLIRFASYISDGRDKSGKQRVWRGVAFKNQEKSIPPVRSPDYF